MLGATDMDNATTRSTNCSSANGNNCGNVNTDDADDERGIAGDANMAASDAADSVRCVLNSRAYDDVAGPCTCKCSTCTDALDKFLDAYIAECHLFDDGD